MYFLETNIFWPNPHPTRTHHMKFPVPSSGHSTTVPWRVILYLFNFYFFFNSPILTPLAIAWFVFFFPWPCHLSLHASNQDIVCLFPLKIFFVSNEIKLYLTWSCKCLQGSLGASLTPSWPRCHHFSVAHRPPWERKDVHSCSCGRPQNSRDVFCLSPLSTLGGLWLLSPLPNP